jgi:carbon dioxide concentrating mechanism protein CcmM
MTCTPRRNAGLVLAAALAFIDTTLALAKHRHAGEVDVSAAAPVVVNGSFVSPLVERFGRVQVGRGVFVAGNSVLRADPGRRVCLGSATNIQDNVFVLALGDRPAVRGTCARYATQTGRRTSLAHQAEVINSRIGQFTFIGFHARVFNAVVEDGAFILHGAVVRHVRIPRDRIVAIGQRVSTQAAANALPRKQEAHADFQREVLEVNKEFAEGYGELYRHHGHAAVTGISPSPRTSFNRGLRPTIGDGLVREPFARIVGDVRLGRDVTLGRRTSIRADEGAPIVIGANARIEDRVTFHALSGTSITIGDRLNTDDNVVFHGPLRVGDDLTIADDAILFRAAVGDRVTIGDSAIVAGPADDPIELADATQVPPNAVITTQAQADALQ